MREVLSLYVVELRDALVGNIVCIRFFVTLVQADILEQLMLKLEHSIRTTSRYPGRLCMLSDHMLYSDKCGHKFLLLDGLKQ